MMAERPVLRLRAHPADADDPPYSFLNADDSPHARPDTIGDSPYPGSEEPARGRDSEATPQSMDTGPDPGARRPPRAGAAPPSGLYDLPGLLARIWSVPAARMATSGSYTPEAARAAPLTPAVGPSPEVPSVQPTPSIAPPPWWYPTVSRDPSLPLAAVPTLSPARPRPPAAPNVRPPEGSRAVDEAAFNPVTQYVAWRRPPCHLAYARRFEMSRADRGNPPASGAEIGRVTVTTDSYPPAVGPLILPATLPWGGHRRWMHLVESG